MSGLWIDGLPRPDHGEGMIQRVCDCGAGWVGLPDDECGWCYEAHLRQLEEQRRRLLWPEWMIKPGPRYDELSEVDQAVWDRTRGQTRDAGSIEAWAERLARAVRSGLITAAEAETALTRGERYVA